MLGQERRNRLRVADVPLHPHGQRLQPLQEEERVERAQRRTEIAQVFDARLHQVAVLAEGFGEADAVVTGRRLGHAGKLAVVPGKAAGLDDDAADRRAVPADELGGGVDDDVGAMLDRPAEIRRGEGVVDHQRHTGLVRDLGDRGDVEDTDLRGLPIVSP